jgi:hypothetical protein
VHQAHVKTEQLALMQCHSIHVNVCLDSQETSVKSMWMNVDHFLVNTELHAWMKSMSMSVYVILASQGGTVKLRSMSVHPTHV